MKIISRLLALACATIVLAGCISGGRNFDDSKVSQIKKGETTEPELVSLFGLPMSRSVNSDNELRLTWGYQEINSRPENFIPVAGLFMQGKSGGGKTLSVILADGKVKDYTFSTSGSVPAPVKTADKN